MLKLYVKVSDKMIKLIDGDPKYLEEYKEAYNLSIQKIKDGLIKKHDLMFTNPDEVDIIQKMKDNRDKTKLKPNYVPSYDYFIVDDEKFIGRISIRTELTPALLQYGGNIGYGINPKYWKQGYGTIALNLALKKAIELGLEENLLITCDDDNIGSYKIIEKNGGILENKVENTDEDETFLTRRYWVSLKKILNDNHSYQLIPYNDNYYDFVFNVKKNAYIKYVEECWGQWNEEDQRKYFDNFINKVKENAHIIKCNDKYIGFYNGELLENGNYKVGNICIIPEYQGKGIGTKILQDILKEYENTDIEIQYFKQNPVGKLYERLGFVPSGETKFHYQMIKHKTKTLMK